MKIEDMLMGRRVRQNHALEHATFTILAQMNPNLSGGARSFSDGFIVFGNANPIQLRQAAEEALRRLQQGEAELAIHPNCGTNLSVGISLLTIGTLLSLAATRQRTRFALTAASSIAGWAMARPLGAYVQKHFTTLPDLRGVRITDVFQRKVLGATFTYLHTVQE
jgi:hypothetical protein